MTTENDYGKSLWERTLEKIGEDEQGSKSPFAPAQTTAQASPIEEYAGSICSAGSGDPF